MEKNKEHIWVININEEDKLEDFKNAVQDFINDNYMVKSGDINAVIVIDDTDGGKHYDKSIKELFEEVRNM